MLVTFQRPTIAPTLPVETQVAEYLAVQHLAEDIVIRIPTRGHIDVPMNKTLIPPATHML